jgi:hypothetical protein
VTDEAERGDEVDEDDEALTADEYEGPDPEEDERGDREDEDQGI